MPTGRQTPTQSATFISCTFKNMIGRDVTGSAISFTNIDNGILTITKCLFDHCEAKVSQGNGVGGGAMYAKSVSKVDISSSSFLYCLCKTIDNSDGGAIELTELSSQPKISGYIFCFCYADDDGGGVVIWKCYAFDLFVSSNCRFINCSIPNGDSNPFYSLAGGLMLWKNNGVFKCSDFLFAYNEGWYGGAYATNVNTDTPNYPLRFCFFHANTATYGSDISFEFYQKAYATEYFSDCFTTSSTNSVHDHENSKDYSDWLPLGASSSLSILMKENIL